MPNSYFFIRCHSRHSSFRLTAVISMVGLYYPGPARFRSGWATEEPSAHYPLSCYRSRQPVCCRVHPARSRKQF
jgi:hypothetical protein